MIKYVFLLCVLMANIINSHCQKFDTIYYNRNWEEINNPQRCRYYRIMVQKNDSTFFVQDHYKNGIIQMIGSYKSLDPQTEFGKFEYFNKKGKVNGVELYNYDEINDTIKDWLLKKYNSLNNLDELSINYIHYISRKYQVKGITVNEKQFGFWSYYNSDGSLNYILEYNDNNMDGKVYQVFDSNDGVDKKYHGFVYLDGNHTNGKKDGEWIYYNPDGTIYEKRNYNNGKLVSKERL